MRMIAAIAVAFIVSTGLSLLLVNARGRLQVLDIPNERSLHSRPTPRTGGIAILLGGVAALLTAWYLQGIIIASTPLLVAVALLALLALLDDHHTLGAGLRLLIQLGTVTLLLLSQGGLQPLTLAAAGLLLLWMINLYNFMDGMDGFAAGMAVIGFGTFALLAWQAGMPAFALGCAITVAAAAGFLLLNFPPARLFMGDSGSTVLGLLAAVVMLKAHISGLLPLWLGLLVFSPFIVDASVTLATRAVRGEKVWLPHKTHYYQKLVELGWGHKRTVLAEYALMIACSATALAAAPRSPALQAVIITGWALLYAMLIYLIRRTAHRREAHT
jgi:UDP-N-acetylmuramyl pentapeptide phosphotransferase/UDP-N-acetylglucosamine-1-phosphate transferase